MDKKEAYAALRKMYGTKARFRYDKKALTADEKEALREKMPEISAAEKIAAEARDKRKEELLQDPEYLRLAELAKEAREERQAATAKLHQHRVTVGEVNELFFIVTGEGDNWAEAIREARKK